MLLSHQQKHGANLTPVGRGLEYFRFMDQVELVIFFDMKKRSDIVSESHEVDEIFSRDK